MVELNSFLSLILFVLYLSYLCDICCWLSFSRVDIYLYIFCAVVSLCGFMYISVFLLF